jgi:AsmA protein
VKRRHRWLLAAAATILLLPLVAVLALRLWLDPERLRQRVQASARSQLGLPLTLHDKLSWSWWPLLAIETGSGAIDDAAGQPLLRWQHLQLGAQWRGLIHDDLLIDSLRVAGLVAQLRRDAAGRGNWEVLFNQPRGSGLLQIGRLQLADGAISFVDAGTQRFWQASQLAAQFGLAANPVASTVTLTSPTVTGRISGTGLSSSGEPLSFSTPRLVLNTTTTAVETAPLQLRYANLALTVTASGELRFAPLQGAGELQINSAAVRRTLAAFEVAIPETRDVSVLGPVAATAQWHITGSAADISSLRLQLDATTVQGDVHWPLAGNGVLSFALRGDRLDADRYLPPSGQTSATAALPLDALRALKLRGSLTLDSLTLRGVTARGARILVDE